MSAERTEMEESLKSKAIQQIDRIKKQDDDEQWISGEELCTEGSSDDETTAPVKQVMRQRKSKKLNQLLTTTRPPRRPSPLAQPTAKEVAPPAPESTESSARHSSNDEDTDMEPIPWRPKRDVDEDGNTFEQLINDTNEQYLEMLETIKGLRGTFFDDEIEQSTERASLTEENMEAIARGDEAIQRVLEDIVCLDREIGDAEARQMEEYKSRLEEQVKICEAVKIVDKYNPLKKSSQSFIDLFRNDNDAYKKLQERTELQNKKKPNTKSSKLNTTITKIQEVQALKATKPFVARNIQIAGERGINALPLSDEQKGRLMVLLEDIDIDESRNVDAQEENSANKLQLETIKLPQINGFIHNDTLRQDLASIDEKLTNLTSEINRSDRLIAVVASRVKAKVKTGFKLKGVQQELRRIDKNLKNYRQLCKNEATNPLSGEQMELLVQSCISDMTVMSMPNLGCGSKEGNQRVNVDLSQFKLSDELRAKLLLDAKINCPRFQFAYCDESNAEVAGEKNQMRDPAENLRQEIEEPISMICLQ